MYVQEQYNLKNAHRSKVCNFDLYCPVRAVHTGPPDYRYADRPLPGGSIKNRPSMVNFGHRRPIEEEIDRRRSIEEENGKKKRKRKRKKRGIKNTSPVRRPRPPARDRRPRVARSRFFSRARRRSVSPRGETDRGDIAPLFLFLIIKILYYILIPGGTHCAYRPIRVPYRYRQYVGTPVRTGKSNLA
ncbi:hypothetical protein GW17_00046190 [Ensete ventricosum]|nr:hypothetical protein GW17_00046190 [Ensete ventricosum]